MHRRSNQFRVALILLLTLLNGCHKAPPSNNATSTETLRIAPEDITTIHANAHASGPIITGSIQPENKADLRAEVSSVVVTVPKENGERVKKGELLVRLDDTSLRDGLQSALAFERAALASLDQAQRQLERAKTLRTSGMVSAQALEDAEQKRNTEQSNVAAARTRTVEARQQLQRTEIRAPFDGIVSECKVSSGDTAQIGKELVKVIDPSNMRFEGLVSADSISQVKLGQKVNFNVNGYAGQRFNGIVKRINPQANSITRQVEVLVHFVDSTQPHVAGLYAEGQIEADNATALMIPEVAFVRNGDKVVAWKIKDGKLHKVDVVLGDRDVRRGDYVVRSGVAEGDVLIRNPGSTLKDDQQVKLVP